MSEPFKTQKKEQGGPFQGGGKRENQGPMS